MTVCEKLNLTECIQSFIADICTVVDHWGSYLLYTFKSHLNVSLTHCYNFVLTGADVTLLAAIKRMLFG